MTRWSGGQANEEQSCKTVEGAWLKHVCDRMGTGRCSETRVLVLTTIEMSASAIDGL